MFLINKACLYQEECQGMFKYKYYIRALFKKKFYVYSENKVYCTLIKIIVQIWWIIDE